MTNEKTWGNNILRNYEHVFVRTKKEVIIINSKKLAELTGFSRSTISKVVNGYPDISENTRKKVLEAIEKYKYFPNKSAQKLVGKKSNIIGLLVYTGKSSENSKEHKKIEESLYYSELISKIVDTAGSLGYFVLVSYIDNNGATWEEIFSNGVIDGAIVITGGKKYKDIEYLINTQNNIVLLDYERDIKKNNIVSINSNHFLGGYEATKFLLDKGHKKILHLTGDLKRKSVLDRAKGYKKCLEDNNLVENKIIHGDFSVKSGYEMVKKYIEKNNNFDFTGIFAGNDYIAYGAMEALREYKYNIPKDVSIIGYDNMEICNYTFPKMTSIKHLDDDISENAIKKLINMLNGKEENISTSKIKIIERKSVTKVN